MARRPTTRPDQLPLLDGARAPAPLPILDERLRGTRFVSLPPRSVLNSPEQTGVDFWSLNPYVGCEFGCSYCYARYAHRYVTERAHDAGRLTEEAFGSGAGFRWGWQAFERRVFVKDQILGPLERDLRRYWRSCAAAGGAPAPIVIGTATDPYQPAERRFRITRQILERLARCEELNLGIITKSPLIARDIDLLLAIQRSSELQVYVSLITLDVAIIKRFEARSPRPAVRLRALAKLRAAGIHAGLIIAPVLPGITDDLSHLEALFQAAREAGAQFAHAGPLRLYQGVRGRFLPVLEEHSPRLGERYARAYATRSAVPDTYARALAARIKTLQARYGFPVNDGMKDRYGTGRPARQGELALAGLPAAAR